MTNVGKFMKIYNIRKLMMVIGLSFIIYPLSISYASAQTKAEADSAYVRGEYQQAIKDYEALLKHGASADLYYNLGNAYYRTENITKATIDKITPEQEMFFITWYRSLINLASVDGWARTALIALALAIILALAYLFSERIWLRKVGFFGAIFLIAVFILSNVFAHQQKDLLINRRGAIVTAGAVTVKSTPDKKGTDLFILHEGTKVTVTDASMKEWKGIRLADGKEGWIETKQIELI